MKLTATERLRRFYECFTGSDHVLILINADPDAIACAMSVKRLLWRKVSGVTITHINVIKRPDNLAMIRLLGVKPVPLEDINGASFSRIVMVDSQPDHSPAFDPFTPDVIIDHHPDTRPKAPFVDIRPEYGSNASIMTEYLRSAKIKPSSKLAAGILYAIKTDTSNFERKTLMEDVRAFQFAFRHANIHLVRKMEQADLRLDFIKYFQIGLRHMRMRRSKVFAHLGEVGNPDVCVLIADFFMRIQSVQWSVVSGLYENKLILIFRNDGLRRNAGKIAKQTFNSIGSAGGHKSMARAEIPLENLEGQVNHQDKKALSNWITQQIEKRTVKEPQVQVLR